MKKIAAFIGGFILTFFLLLIIGGVVFYATSPDRYNVLVIGSDQRGSERARSDVLFLVSVPKSGDEQPFFLTIPRDTKIEHEEYGLEKITHFYARGDRPDDGKLLGNVELTRSVVEELLDVDVDATVEVTFSSFEEIIDTLGGATVNGETVSSQEALASIRDRFTGSRSDFDRQADAREVLRSSVTKLKSPAVAQAVLNYFENSEYARLKWKKTKALHFAIGAGIARKGEIAIGEMKEESVPGVGGRIYTPDFGKELYYWIPDEEALKEVVDENLK